MNNRKQVYKLEEISEWHSSDLVELPKIQRGFVWRPNQIEDLWDSLLRKYPIGAFVLSPRAINKFEILDGQQRATAICLGFGKKTFRETEDKVKIFIDLERPDGENVRKYFFRVITKSHPWGYQRYNNFRPLDSDSKRKAMLLLECENILNPDLNFCFPYDASIPIPFNYFLEAAIKSLPDNEIFEYIKSNWNLWEKVHATWIDSLNKNPSWLTYQEIFEINTLSKIEKRVIEVYADVKKMLDEYYIPALYLNFEDFITQKNNKEDKTEANRKIEEDDDENKSDEIENLFIRLNAGGTPLRGEELNYSILKAHISRDLQHQIESSCEGFSQPFRFITIIYRLFQQAQKNQQRDGLSMNIKPKQFQRTISENLKYFEFFIKQILTENKYGGKTLIQYSLFLLEFNTNENPDGLPHIITSKISNTAPEIMFMLLYRINIKGDILEPKSHIHKKVLGIITLFMWLGKGEKHKDHSKLLRNIWPAVETLNRDSFWSSATVKRGMLNEVVPAIPTFSKPRDRNSLQKFIKYSYQSKSDLFNKFDKETEFGSFAYQMFYNRDLILYSQRKFLSTVFNKKEYYLDDTNLPFDWDHISPNKLVYKQQGVPFIIKYWYNSIGNLRAWPYSLNRTDQDVIPAKKLDPINNKWDTEGDSIDFKQGKIKWDEFISKNNDLITPQENLKSKLLEWSACHNAWANCEINDLKKKWPNVFELIRNRSLSILEEWYKKLCIEELIPATTIKTANVFSKIFNRTKWMVNPQWIKNKDHDFNTEEDINWVLKRPIKHLNSEIYIFILHSKDSKLMIQEDNILFGIYDRKSGSYVSSLNLLEKDLLNIDTDKKTYIQFSTTLISTEEEAFIELTKLIKKWIQSTKF